MNELTEIAQKLEAGDSQAVTAAIEQAIACQIPAATILNDGLIAGMNVIGRRFKAGEIFIPNVLIAARAMNAGIALLEPRLAADGVKPVGKLLIGTVQGDLHDIGKTLVNILFKGAGFKIIDLGVNVPAEKFLQAARAEKPDLIGMSALLTTTMLNMESCIRQLRANDVTAPIIIGGAPTSQKFAAKINADLWAASAADGVELAKQAVA